MSETKPSLSLLKRFLSWPSGAARNVLAQCPSDQNYYCALGVLVWLTSLLAGCGMALMLSQTGSVGWQALMGGGAWFLCILNLDRFLLLTTTDNQGWKRLVPVARILLSLCLAIIIGEHIVQYLFRNEINNQLVQERLTAQRSNYDKAREGHPEVNTITTEKERKQGEIERKQAEVQRLRDDYIKEAEGSAGSGIRGKGPLYAQKERDYLAAQAEKQKLDQELKEIDRRLETKNNEIKATAATANAAKADEKGFLAYHRALFAIIRQDPTLLMLYIVISAAMIMFEVTPLISKLSAKVRLYDQVLVAEERRNKENLEKHSDEQEQTRGREVAVKAMIGEKMNEIEISIVERVTDAAKNNDFKGLSLEDAALARSFIAEANGRIAAQVKPRNTDGSHESTRAGGETGASSDGMMTDDTAGENNPSSVTVFLTGTENPSSFTVIFRRPPDQVRGSDLLYTLAGLEQQRPPSDEPHVPLHEYRVSNTRGEEINPDERLFRQMGEDRSVYLSPFELTVSNAEN